MEFSKRLLFFISLFNLVGLSLMGWGLITWQGRDSQQVLLGGEPIYLQIVYGLAYSLAWAFIFISLFQLPRFRNANFLKKIFARPEITLWDVIFVCLGAGIGEEIFFRGAIQYWLGIWPTAIIFIFIHGYLTRKGWFWIGLLSVVMAAGLGYLFEYVGLISAIVAHIFYNFFIILQIRRK